MPDSLSMFEEAAAQTPAERDRASRRFNRRGLLVHDYLQAYTGRAWRTRIVVGRSGGRVWAAMTFRPTGERRPYYVLRDLRLIRAFRRSPYGVGIRARVKALGLKAGSLEGI
jgi:hypothetical protein